MRSFEILSAIAAPLPLDNVDTDKILAALFLKTVKREGLAKALFHRMRFDDDGSERADFILNREPWRQAGILVGGANFGCGSSREHAPWALLDFGFRCVIAKSFADIFFNNCFKNGILPIALAADTVESLATETANPEMAMLKVDLPAQTITRANGRTIAFDIAPEQKRTLLLGLDAITETLNFADAIAAYELENRSIFNGISIDISAEL
jgi:3-isopropylmalate/(R)-2-methylmalate dehydratase small subunit